MALCPMEVKMSTIYYINISEKAEPTASINHIEKPALLFLSKLATHFKVSIDLRS